MSALPKVGMPSIQNVTALFLNSIKPAVSKSVVGSTAQATRTVASTNNLGYQQNLIVHRAFSNTASKSKSSGDSQGSIPSKPNKPSPGPGDTQGSQPGKPNKPSPGPGDTQGSQPGKPNKPPRKGG